MTATASATATRNASEITMMNEANPATPDASARTVLTAFLNGIDTYNSSDEEFKDIFDPIVAAARKVLESPVQDARVEAVKGLVDAAQVAANILFNVKQAGSGLSLADRENCARFQELLDRRIKDVLSGSVSTALDSSEGEQKTL